MSFLGFIKSRLFIKHTLIAFLLTIVLIWVILRLLNLYTRHSTYITVPDFSGISTEQLDNIASDNGLQVLIIDSLYNYSLNKGTVAIQDPLPGSKVKKNRKIYVTVVAMKPEQVGMPNLVDLTLRQATAMLETYGLKTGSLIYVPDFAHNAILKQKFKGKEIKPGTLIEKGSKIDLVVGKSEDNALTIVPDLFGQKQSQALDLLQNASMNIGSEVFMDGNDTIHARVYKQKPEANTSVQYGGSVDLWDRSDKKFYFKTD